jgi:hypothetical protein
VEPHLARFAADLKWLQTQGVAVERFNLAQQPGAFAEDQSVRAGLESNGEASLPVIQVNGEIKSSGVYPTRAELAAWTGLGKPSARRAIQLTAVEEPCCAPADKQPGSKPSCC